MLFYPTAIGWHPKEKAGPGPSQRSAWQTIQRAHAIANGIPVLACNRSGHEADPSGQSEGIQFWGNSFVCGPQGEVIAQAGATEEAVLMANIDMARSESVRRIWPYLRDRRIDAYYELVLRYRD